MALANLASIVAEAWQRALALGAYGHEPLTVGWYRGEAHVWIWNYRTDAMTWRRHPARDVPVGHEPEPQHRNPFASSSLYWALR